MPEYKLTNRVPYLYFVRTTDGQYLKVGITSKPAGRIHTIRKEAQRLFPDQESVAVEYLLIAHCDDARPQETRILETFAQHRIGGEWFRSHPDILEYIDMLRARKQSAPLAAFISPLNPNSSWGASCPHCKKLLTQEHVRGFWASYTSSMRKTRSGGTNGGRRRKVAEVQV